MMPIIAFQDEELQDWEDVAPERVISGTPREAFKILYSDGGLTAGIYACNKGKWRTDYTGENEYCRLMAGSVVLTGENGIAQRFDAPTSFLIPAGFKGTWEPLSDIRKFFVIHKQAGA